MERRAPVSTALPSAGRRIAIIAIYALAGWLIVASIGIGVASDACLDNREACTTAERVTKGGLGLLFLAALTFCIRFGWSGRLPGARPRRFQGSIGSRLGGAARWKAMLAAVSRSGLTAIASWIIWPSVFFNGYWLANIFLMTGRRCSIEGCDPPRNDFLALLFLAAMFGPPIYLTVAWFRRRRAS